MTIKKISGQNSEGGRVFLTGGTGFVASHVLDCLLDHGFDVVVSVRSQEKGNRMLESIASKKKPDQQVSFVVVPNIAEEGAFDEVLKQYNNLDYVIHTASPYQLSFADPVKECLDPAIKGTTGVLKSIHAYAPTVKRVVITSSSAAILNPPNHRKVYDESSWSEVTWEQAMEPEHTYRASKKFAEKSAWDFLSTVSPKFDLATINNTYTFGPLPRSLPPTSLAEGINTSNKRILDLVSGNMRSGIQPTAPVFTFVDVRDVALAHVRAMTRPEAGGKRFYMVGGFFSNPKIAGIIAKNYPELKEKLPNEGKCKDDVPEDHWGFDNKRSKEVLGIRYRDLEESVVDTVDSILEMMGRLKN
ncbi:putative NADPH-dependent methylglyoxal reductase [Podospora australis]|uniref:NADPH-dependent methylglyoxal reductase n=1 Tax=Podospora australis TaxID=1536484 RepID=A0AAN6WYL0_9PEZI|nr:putative NADPH-dependent methylglyoxal reductase [Podospora australis]